jgi:heme A synthase
LKELVLYGRLAHPLDLGFQLAFGVIAITAMLQGWEWLHKLLAPISGVLFLIYIALIFRRLH